MSNNMKSNTIALIMAAGRGHRLAGEVPKQYRVMKGKTLLRHAIEQFLQHPDIDHVRVVIHPEDKIYYQQATNGLTLLPPVEGGERRQDSVREGLESLKSLNCSKVLIHDAARPFISKRIIDDVIHKLATHAAVVPILPVLDSLKKLETQGSMVTVNRQHYVRTQTPQAFEYNMIMKYHETLIDKEYTDDIALCEEHGITIGTVEGSLLNGKITTQEDINTMERLAVEQCYTRTGMGFDVHKFADEPQDTDIMLCGVAVPHTHKILAHSDGDVGLHALVDALLGTIAAGDIGMHFPPEDPKWKDRDSSDFILHARKLVEEKDGKIDHVDITLICERPKVRAHVDTMRAHVAELLELPIDHVSIKATTTEKLGFTGRKEGIAAQAVASVRFKE